VVLRFSAKPRSLRVPHAPKPLGGTSSQEGFNGGTSEQALSLPASRFRPKNLAPSRFSLPQLGQIITADDLTRAGGFVWALVGAERSLYKLRDSDGAQLKTISIEGDPQAVVPGTGAHEWCTCHAREQT
jgi:hypothetical protein